MKKPAYLKWILIAEAAGALSGLISMPGMEFYASAVEKPVLTPPAAVFPIVWVILYALMGIGAARVWAGENSVWRKWGLNLWVIQLVVNFFWSPIFFNVQAYGFALFWLLLLWVLVLGMILLFRKADPLAALLQVPYLLWLTLAAWLNFGVWQLNS